VKTGVKGVLGMISCNIFGLDVKILICCQDECLNFFKQNEPGYFSDHIATAVHNRELFGIPFPSHILDVNEKSVELEEEIFSN
jgi:hypothetical protein